MSTPTHPDFAHPDSVNPSSTEHVPARIVVSELSKKFGTVQAVDRLSFVVEPGQVTGFLGPNGAGKTTTLRMVLDLITPDSGSATYGGVPYSALPKPSSLVGAVLETAFHPGRSGRNHLLVYCAAAGLPSERADAVLEQVGMTDAARRKTGGYSMGMRQRLGLAAALLGDPQVLILDEPANGLDPEGIQWLRNFLRHLAHDQGRTILVSSHLLAEVQQTVDRIVIIAAGRLVREGTIADLADPAQASVHVRSPSVEALRPALIEAGAHVEQPGPGELSVRGMPIAAIGHLAFTSGVELHELRSATTDLEEIYFRLTAGQEQFKGASHDPEAPAPAAPEVQAS